MKKILLFLAAIALLASCNSGSNKSTKDAQTGVKSADYKSKSFNDLFTSADIKSDVFLKTVGSEIAVLTSGSEQDYNSMVIGWGGWGTLFEKPATWCFLRANRYTLEYIKKTKTYTISYFDKTYNDQVMFLGSKTGRGTDKMKENMLTAIKIPSGNMAYKEARLIVECSLTELTTVSPKDFYTKYGQDFINDGYKEAKDYHKMVFGEIVNVWKQK
jgi:flavin reductase (DIM6/NTAB) family NADH-FMN oxidoreductase RutF